uniref:Uncharacterized protein n=1 Tax=Castor canadensis TaxID=51338 RepID=A0A8C0ZP45_CASCN
LKFYEGHSCLELAKIHCKAERSPTTVTSSTNSRKENGATKVLGFKYIKCIFYLQSFQLTVILSG